MLCGARLNDHLAEASERGDDFVGQDGRSLSEHVTSDELVGRLFDDQGHIDWRDANSARLR